MSGPIENLRALAGGDVLSQFAVSRAVMGDLDAIATIDRCGALGDGQLICILAAANGHVHILEYLHRRGFDLRGVGSRAMHLARANGRAAVLTYLGQLGLDGAQGSSAARPAAPYGKEASHPTVSVLLANYNHARYLDSSLSAIFAQTVAASEVIVVDDGSTDESVEVIRGYAERHRSLQPLLNGANRGQHYSIQRALEAASGKYVVWASSDDLLLPRFLERSLEVLRQHPDAGLCFSRLAVFEDGSSATRIFTPQVYGQPYDYGYEVRYFTPAELIDLLRLRYQWMSGNTVVVKRQALLDIGGFDARLRWHADWFAYYAIALRYGACSIPETLAMMRERVGTYSASGMHDAKAQKRVLVALLDVLKEEKHRDLLPLFQGCPSLFWPFGYAMARAALATPRHYDFTWSMIRWFGPRFVRRRWQRLRRAFS